MGIIRERILQGYEKAKEAVLLRVKIPDEVLKANLDGRVNPAIRELVSMVGGTGLEGIVRKDARSIIPELSGLGAQLYAPPYDGYRLQRIYEKHWTTRACVDKLVRETTRNVEVESAWKPKYEAMCDACHTDYQHEVPEEKCPECGGELKPPDPGELARAKEWLSACNPQFTAEDILKRYTKDLLLFDDAYLSLTRGTHNTFGIELWPEDARAMRIQADERGRRGVGKTYCQACEVKKPVGAETNTYPASPGSPCPRCGGTLVAMAYAQVVGGVIHAAWTDSEITHTNLWAVGSRLHGTPKLWAVVTQIEASQLIDMFQRDSFDKAKSPKNIFAWFGLAEESLRRQLAMIESQRKNNPLSDQHIILPPKQSITAGGQVGVEVIRAMSDPLIAGSLAYSEWYTKIVCYTFGVSPASLGVETPGKLGGTQAGQEQRDVTPETINEIKVQVGESFDSMLKRMFPEIVSWSFNLETAHEDEEKNLWDIKKLQMETSKLAVDAGFTVNIGEDGEPTISGEGSRQVPPQNPFGTQSTGTDAGVENEESPGFDKRTDIEKVSRFQRLQRYSAIAYKKALDGYAKMVFDRVNSELNVLFSGRVTAKTEGEEIIGVEFGRRIVKSIRRILRNSEKDASLFARAAAKELLSLGADDAAREVERAFNFSIPDESAIKSHEDRTIDAMRNTLYVGERDSYLSKVRGVVNESIEDEWGVDQLARELRKQIDPEREAFADYMWERIARTETATYITEGRRLAYKEMGVPKLRRIVTVDERTSKEKCLPFSDAIYLVEDAQDVIPAHPNCRCAFAPYLGDAEPLDSSFILRNG